MGVPVYSDGLGDTILFDLRAGDVLLYQGRGFFAWLIRVKTWSRVSHVEVYADHGRTWASRDGRGVGTYRLRRDGLVGVLRPPTPPGFDRQRAAAFHASCLHQRYDWWGLLRFFSWGRQTRDRQFCSEYAARLLRVAGCRPFAPGFDADLVSPGMFLSSSNLEVVWAHTWERMMS